MERKGWVKTVAESWWGGAKKGGESEELKEKKSFVAVVVKSQPCRTPKR